MSRNSAVKILTAVVTACLFILFAQASEAAVYRFGKDESIDKIQQTEIKDPDGKPLDLAHKLTTTYFVAGVSVHDDGYVLQSRDKPKRYYSLSQEEIARFQANGLLPNPLPKYSLSVFEYFAGYSLWIVAVVVICWTIVSSLRKKQPQPVATTGTADPTKAA